MTHSRHVAAMIAVALIATVTVGVVRLATHSSGHGQPRGDSRPRVRVSTSPTPYSVPSAPPQTALQRRTAAFSLDIFEACEYPTVRQDKAIVALTKKGTALTRVAAADVTVSRLEQERIRKLSRLTPPGPAVRQFHAYLTNLRFLAHSLRVEMRVVDARIHGRASPLDPSTALRLTDRVRSTGAAVDAYGKQHDLAQCWV